MRAFAFLALFCFDDEKIDPLKYKGPAEAKSAALSTPASRAARPYLGITVGEPADEGGVLSDVAEDSPAWTAGMRAGDRVAEFAGKEVREGDRLLRLLGARTPGEMDANIPAARAYQPS